MFRIRNNYMMSDKRRVTQKSITTERVTLFIIFGHFLKRQKITVILLKIKEITVAFMVRIYYI